MSTGINIQVEWQGPSGRWYWQRQVPAWVCHTCCGAKRFPDIQGAHDCFVCEGTGVMRTPYFRTNYPLFSFLCGVEEGTSSHLSIAPRGVPEDLSDELYHFMDWLKDSRSNALFKCPFIGHMTFAGLWFDLDWGIYNVAALGRHDHSWAGLDELLDYDYAIEDDGRELDEKLGGPWFDFIAACKKIDPDPRRVRLVFGFGH